MHDAQENIKYWARVEARAPETLKSFKSPPEAEVKQYSSLEFRGWVCLSNAFELKMVADQTAFELAARYTRRVFELAFEHQKFEGYESVWKRQKTGQITEQEVALYRHEGRLKCYYWLQILSVLSDEPSPISRETLGELLPFYESYLPGNKWRVKSFFDIYSFLWLLAGYGDEYIALYEELAAPTTSKANWRNQGKIVYEMCRTLQSGGSLGGYTPLKKNYLFSKKWYNLRTESGDILPWWDRLVWARTYNLYVRGVHDIEPILLDLKGTQ